MRGGFADGSRHPSKLADGTLPSKLAGGHTHNRRSERYTRGIIHSLAPASFSPRSRGLRLARTRFAATSGAAQAERPEAAQPAANEAIVSPPSFWSLSLRQHRRRSLLQHAARGAAQEALCRPRGQAPQRQLRWCSAATQGHDRKARQQGNHPGRRKIGAPGAAASHRAHSWCLASSCFRDALEYFDDLVVRLGRRVGCRVEMQSRQQLLCMDSPCTRWLVLAHAHMLLLSRSDFSERQANRGIKSEYGFCWAGQ